MTDTSSTSSTPTPTVVLINESKRAWSLPARPVPEERAKLTPRGKPKTVGLGELERVQTFRPPLLEVGGRLEVPAWYFDAIKTLRALKPVWNRKVDGIAVGRTRTEEQRNAAAAREAELIEAARVSRAAADAEIAKARETTASLTKQAAEQDAEIKRLRAELEKARSKSEPKSEPKA